MRIPSNRAVLVVAAVAVLGPAVIAGLGCELIVQLDPALVDSGEQDGLAVEEEIEETSSPEGSTPESGAGEAGDAGDAGVDSTSEASAESGGDTSVADSADSASETSSTESGAESGAD
jgi:hypothetical protein